MTQNTGVWLWFTLYPHTPQQPMPAPDKKILKESKTSEWAHFLKYNFRRFFLLSSPWGSPLTTELVPLSCHIPSDLINYLNHAAKKLPSGKDKLQQHIKSVLFFLQYGINISHETFLSSWYISDRLFLADSQTAFKREEESDILSH